MTNTMTIDEWSEQYGDSIIQNPEDGNEFCGHVNAEFHRVDQSEVLELENNGNQIWTRLSGDNEILVPGWAVVGWNSWVVTSKKAPSDIEEVMIWSERDQAELDEDNAFELLFSVVQSYCTAYPEESDDVKAAWDLVRSLDDRGPSFSKEIERKSEHENLLAEWLTEDTGEMWFDQWSTLYGIDPEVNPNGSEDLYYFENVLWDEGELKDAEFDTEKYQVWSVNYEGKLIWMKPGLDHSCKKFVVTEGEAHPKIEKVFVWTEHDQKDEDARIIRNAQINSDVIPITAAGWASLKLDKNKGK